MATNGAIVQHRNENIIRKRLADEAVCLMQIPGMSKDRLVIEVEAFIREADIPQIWNSDLEHALKCYIPGLYNRDEIQWSLLWKKQPKQFCKMPDTLIELFLEGIIDSGIWTDIIRKKPREFYTPEIIQRIKDTCGDRDGIKTIIESSEVGSRNSLATEIAVLLPNQDDPVDSKELFSSDEVSSRLAKTRPNQNRLRDAVLERYGKQCAVCSIKIGDLLEAAHIVPKAEDGIDEAYNGLVLCANHHRAFDRGLFVIIPQGLLIKVRDDIGDRAILGISQSDILHLVRKPQIEAISRRYKIWLAKSGILHYSPTADEVAW
jgi:hypothetical protein